MQKLVSEVISSKEEMYSKINFECRTILFNIGKYLNGNPFVLDSLYEEFYMTFGNTVMFSKRSLIFAKIFYKKYHEIITMFPSNMTWNHCVALLRKNYSIHHDILMIQTIALFSLNEKEIDYFLHTGDIKFITDDGSVNNIVLEFMNL